MIQRQTTSSLHNNPPSQRNCKILCHNNWAIIPDPTMSRTSAWNWNEHDYCHGYIWLTSTKTWFLKWEKNRWRARVTGNRCKGILCKFLNQQNMSTKSDNSVWKNLNISHMYYFIVGISYIFFKLWRQIIPRKRRIQSYCDRPEMGHPVRNEDS